MGVSLPEDFYVSFSVPPFRQWVRVKCVSLTLLIFSSFLSRSFLAFLVSVPHLGGGPSSIDLLGFHICQCRNVGHSGSQMCGFQPLPVRVRPSVDAVPLDLVLSLHYSAAPGASVTTLAVLSPLFILFGDCFIVLTLIYVIMSWWSARFG